MQAEISKSGIPCLWETGGGRTNTGESQIICDSVGSPKIPIYVRRKGHLANLNHALIPIFEGYYIIDATHQRADFEISIAKILQISENLEISCNVVNRFYNGEWDNPLPQYLIPAVEAATKKAMMYHCKVPVFIQEEEKENALERY